MRAWRLLLNTNNLISTPGDLYACTPNAWTSISKFISLLLEECWASSSNLIAYSGLLKGFVRTEDYRYIWFDDCQYAGIFDIDVIQFGEGSTFSDKNTLYWFYLPHTYRNFTCTYIDLKSLHLGRVDFVIGNELVTQVSDESVLFPTSELHLVAADPKDLLFYCIQSQHMSRENVVMANEGNCVDISMVIGFPQYQFRCISALDFYNRLAIKKSIQSRVVTKNVEHNADTSCYDLKLEVTSTHTVDYEFDETCILKSIKDEPDEVVQETQLNLEDEQQHLQHQQSPQQHKLPFLKRGCRRVITCTGTNGISFSRLLSISKRYGELAALKEDAECKIWRSLSSRVGPSLVLQCPGCGKFFPQSSPTRLYDMLSHLRSRHRTNTAKLLPSLRDVLDILIPFMQKSIAVWNTRKRNRF